MGSDSEATSQHQSLADSRNRDYVMSHDLSKPPATAGLWSNSLGPAYLSEEVQIKQWICVLGKLYSNT